MSRPTMRTEKMAETVAALEAAGWDRTKAAEALGITVLALAFRIYVCRRRGVLPPAPARKPGPQQKSGDPRPIDKPAALVLDAAARVAGGCPERNDAGIVRAWDGYDDPLDRPEACAAAAKRILSAIGG